MAGPYYTTITGAGTGLSAVTSSDNNPELGNRIPRGLHTLGGVAIVERVYALLGTEAATEKIRLCRNIAGMQLLIDQSNVTVENPGTALVFDVGDDADPDGYVDGLTVSAGGHFAFTAGGTQAARLQDPVITSDDSDDGQGDWIYATIATATALSAGAELRFRLYFAANS